MQGVLEDRQRLVRDKPDMQSKMGIMERRIFKVEDKLESSAYVFKEDKPIFKVTINNILSQNVRGKDNYVAEKIGNFWKRRPRRMVSDKEF